MPLLELTQNRFYFTLNEDCRASHFVSINKTKDLFNNMEFKNYFLFGRLFDLFDWYPNEVKFFHQVEHSMDLLFVLENYPFIKNIENNKVFKCKLILRFDHSSRWFVGKKVQIIKRIKNIIGQNVTVIFDESKADTSELETIKNSLGCNEEKHFCEIIKK